MIQYITIAAVLFLFIFIGVFRLGKIEKNSNYLLLADRSAGFLKIGASLFTLIGAGEIIALSSLAFLFGFSGIFLFLGYSVAFCVLGVFGSKIRAMEASKGAKTIVEFANNRVGPWFAFVTFLCSFMAFFSLLMLQFSAIATILPDQTHLARMIVIFSVAAAIFIYLGFGGGLVSVFRTDMFQGILMFLLISVVLILFLRVDHSSKIAHEFSSPDFPNSWGLLISGFFVGIASADVWQRLFAAKRDKDAKNGFFLGAFALLIYGFLILSIGRIVAGIIPDLDSNLVFFKALDLALPGSLMFIGTTLLLSALISTADTEIFLLTTMLTEEIRKRSQTFRSYLEKNAATMIGAILLLITFISGIAAIWAENLLFIYTWLLYALISISPALWISIFFRVNDKIAFLSVVLNWIILLFLFIFDIISLEKIYYYAIPCFATAILAFALTKPKFDVEKALNETS